ncbi:hypothetical protein [Aetokthonos hydrillicola]|jgi:uncharacterized protein YbaP (TraB family)|uniref:hypothetical protein n=1 Tax=Aetokthonos hydrillicola TaxID=1550245 RepID=UPI001ABAD1E6|nr:hypothetical protein [Aetokthonos hydrillicola]MBW4588580.1 hypothetical protein [Aetokthonos hydrillicola CCALA 1050]
MLQFTFFKEKLILKAIKVALSKDSTRDNRSVEDLDSAVRQISTCAKLNVHSHSVPNNIGVAR